MATTTVERKLLLINNEWRPASAGKTMDVVNPATEETIAAVASADAADVDAAVKAARAALDGPWGKMSARERGRIVSRMADRLMEKADAVARLETLHNGKPNRGTSRSRPRPSASSTSRGGPTK
jgi:acyl-CoA reductase-like NAD-dependent aldehyde dehydrogenase